MRTNFLQLERAFFDHAKTDFIIEKHGITGAYCLLYIWSEMMHRDGAFNPNNELDLLGAAKRAKISIDEVKALIKSAIKVNLLTYDKKAGFIIKDRIDEALDKLISVSEQRSIAGKAGVAAKRERKAKEAKEVALLKQNESFVEPNHKLLTNELINKESTPTEGSRGTTSESSIGTPMPATVGPFWGLLAVKVGLKEDDERFYKVGKAEFDRIEKHPLRKKIEAMASSCHSDHLKSSALALTMQWFIEQTEREEKERIQNEPEELP